MLKYPPRLHHHSRILQITRHPFSHQKHIEFNHEYPKNTVKLKCQMWTLCVGCSLKWVATYGSIDVESSKMVDKFWIMKKSSGVFVLLFYFPSIIFCTIFIGVFLLLSFKEAWNWKTEFSIMVGLDQEQDLWCCFTVTLFFSLQDRGRAS